MKEATITLPEIGAIAATRGMLGAGVGFLLAERIPDSRRKKIGWGLALVGALTTIPLVIDVARKSHTCQAESDTMH